LLFYLSLEKWNVDRKVWYGTDYPRPTLEPAVLQISSVLLTEFLEAHNIRVCVCGFYPAR